MPARDVMTERVICINAGESVFDAAELLPGSGVSALPVVNDKGAIVGIVSEADLIRRSEIADRDQEEPAGAPDGQRHLCGARFRRRARATGTVSA